MIAGGGRRDFLRTVGMGGLALALMDAVRAPGSARAERLLWEGRVTATHWPGIPYGLPVAVGMAKGWFEEVGLKVTEIVAGKGGGHTLNNIVAGGVPLGEVGSPAVVQAVLKNLPVMAVAAGVQTTGSNYILTRDDSPIKAPKDLEGRTCGITNPGAAGHMFTALSLMRQGINVDRVTFRPTGGTGEGIAALQKGGVDCFYVGEPTFSKLKEKGGGWWRVLYDIREVLPWFVQTFWVASTEFQEKHGEAIRRFLKVRARGVHLIQENPAEAAKIYASHVHIPEKEALQVLQHYDVKTYYSSGAFRSDTLADLVKAMRFVKELDPGTEVKWSRIVDQRFLPEAMRIVLPS